MRPAPPRALSGSGLESALDLLTPPFAAAATRDVLPLAGGRFEVAGPRRHPAVLVRLRVNLARSAVVVHAEVDGVGQPAVVFAAYSPAGSLLPLYVPRLPAGSDGTGSFTVTARVWHLDGPEVAGSAHDAGAVAAPTGAPLDDTAAAGLVEAVVLDGTLSRLVYLSTLEKQRLIAVGREITAGRHVGLARGAALDAHGADLSVPRLTGEPDDSYRARLAVFSSWRLATPAGFRAALNGPGPDDTPSAGLPATVGVTARFRLVEQSNPLAVAVRLVEVGGTVPLRERFQALLTGGLLFDLDRPAVAQLPESARERLERVRASLNQALARDGADDTRYLTTLAATTLERAVRMLHLLTGDGSLTPVRALTTDPDPRHELGLGVTVKRVDRRRLDRAAKAARAARQAAAAGEPVTWPGAGEEEVPAELVAAVLGTEPRDTDDDPIGAWIFTAAGMATVTAPDDDTLHLSPLPSLGLVVEGPAQLAHGADAEFRARLRQDDSSGRHVLVEEAWGRAGAELESLGGDPEPLAPQALRDALDTLAGAAAELPPALAALVPAGLAPALPGELAARVLEAYDLDLLLGILVDDDATGVDPASSQGQELRERMVARCAALTAAGFHSVRVLPAPGTAGVLLLAALSVLPGGANRPGEPPPAAYRWYVTELPAAGQGAGPLELRRGVGGRALVHAARPGLALLVCVAYVRRGLADPYEVRVELPGDEVLTLDQYGYVMNLLEHLCPLGVEINTFDLRRNHVSVDGAEPTFLSSRVSRSYTRFRRRRTGGTDRHPDADRR